MSLTRREKMEGPEAGIEAIVKTGTCLGQQSVMERGPVTDGGGTRLGVWVPCDSEAMPILLASLPQHHSLALPAQVTPSRCGEWELFPWFWSPQTGHGGEVCSDLVLREESVSLCREGQWRQRPLKG